MHAAVRRAERNVELQARKLRTLDATSDTEGVRMTALRSYKQLLLIEFSTGRLLNTDKRTVSGS
jgi:hypothetical protein